MHKNYFHKYNCTTYTTCKKILFSSIRIKLFNTNIFFAKIITRRRSELWYTTCICICPKNSSFDSLVVNRCDLTLMRNLFIPGLLGTVLFGGSVPNTRVTSIETTVLWMQTFFFLMGNHFLFLRSFWEIPDYL